MFMLGDLAFAVLSYAIAHVIVVCVYRVTLHPFAKYPGPLLAKFTLLYGTYYAYIGDIHIDIEKCHKKHGKFVRYGPNSLLVNSVDGYHDIYDNGKKVKKAKTYIVHGKRNLLGIQDKAEYAKLKKSLQLGFSDAANRENEPKVIQLVDKFVEKMSENEDPSKCSDGWTNPKNMALWSNYLTTDVISKVVFTTSWDLLISTANRGIPETFKTVVRLIGTLHHWPHLPTHKIGAIICFPHLMWSLKALEGYSNVVMASSTAARNEDPNIKDVFGQFNSYKDPETGELALDAITLQRNSENFIIAGSDTTASSLSATFFYLSNNPTAYAKVANEIRTTFSSASAIRAGTLLNSCIYLRAAINESLRMSPVTPQPLWRETETGGCVIDREVIPAGFNVGAGIFSLHHRAESFPDPYRWDLERWISDGAKDEFQEKERIREISKSYAPFSVGPRQCIAKNFALMEMMLALAKVFWSLEFERVGTLGEGRKGLGEGREREDEFQIKGYFTSFVEGPEIRFKRRKI